MECSFQSKWRHRLISSKTTTTFEWFANYWRGVQRQLAKQRTCELEEGGTTEGIEGGKLSFTRVRRPVLLKPSNRTRQYALDSILCVNYNVHWTPSRHANVRPQTMHGKGFQIWRVAANILNQQLRRADERSVAPCGLNGNLKIPSVKEEHAINL